MYILIFDNGKTTEPISLPSITMLQLLAILRCCSTQNSLINESCAILAASKEISFVLKAFIIFLLL
jgi:hypothetical protein